MDARCPEPTHKRKLFYQAMLAFAGLESSLWPQVEAGPTATKTWTVASDLGNQALRQADL